MTTDTTLKTRDKAQAPVDKTPKGQEPSHAPEEPSPGKTPRTYSQEEVDRITQLTRMEAGREWKVVEVERDALKLQITAKGSELADIAEERVGLEKRIEELASNDPELNNLEKRAKELRDQERKLKDDRRTEEGKWQANTERVKRAEDTLREISIWEVAAEYQNNDPVKLKELCDMFTATSVEQIRKVADTLWVKKVAEPSATPSVKPYSGWTSGGTGFVRNKENPSETLKQGFRSEK